MRRPTSAKIPRSTQRFLPPPWKRATSFTRAMVQRHPDTCTHRGHRPELFGNGTCPWGPGIDPNILTMLRLYPIANGAALGDGLNSGSYSFSSPSPQNLNTSIVRLDWDPVASSSAIFPWQSTGRHHGRRGPVPRATAQLSLSVTTAKGWALATPGKLPITWSTISAMDISARDIVKSERVAALMFSFSVPCLRPLRRPAPPSSTSPSRTSWTTSAGRTEIIRSRLAEMFASSPTIQIPTPRPMDSPTAIFNGWTLAERLRETEAVSIRAPSASPRSTPAMPLLQRGSGHDGRCHRVPARTI